MSGCGNKLSDGFQLMLPPKRGIGRLRAMRRPKRGIGRIRAVCRVRRWLKRQVLTKPRFWARETAWERFETENLTKMFFICALTVSGVIPSDRAISLFV
jgi:hypothetical protein